MNSHRFLFVGLIVHLICPSLTAPVFNESSSSLPTTVPTDEIATNEPDLTMIESSADPGRGKTVPSKVDNNRLMKSIDNLQKRVDQSYQVLTGIVDSFMSNPSHDGSKLEDSLTKYDEIVEDIEADFTKAKLDFGLQMEENIGKVNQTVDSMERQLNQLNQQFINWSTDNRARMTSSLKKGILQFNDFLSSGVELLLEASERGKDVLRNIHRRRFDLNDKQLTPQSNENSGFYIPILGRL